MQPTPLPPDINLDAIKLRGWDYAVDSILITAPQKKWNGKIMSTPIVYVNKSFESMTGYTAQEVIGKDPRILQGPLTDKEVISNITVALRDNTVFRGETYNYKKDGTPFIMNWHIEPIQDEHDTVIAYLAIQRDVTQVRELEQQKKELFAIKTNFVRVVSHQLRTPLTASQWNLELASEEKDEQAKAKMLKTTLTGLERVTQRVQTMLSAMASPHLESMKEDTVETKDLFQQTVDCNVYLQQEKQVKCVAKKASFQFKTNKNIVENALNSIVVNAIVYSEPGSQIILTAKKEDNTIILEVSDTGIGITGTDELALWTAFVRGEAAAKKWTDGFGAELWIAKNNIESVGGSIVVTSAGRDKGTTVQMRLPQ